MYGSSTERAPRLCNAEGLPFVKTLSYKWLMWWVFQSWVMYLTWCSLMWPYRRHIKRKSAIFTSMPCFLNGVIYLTRRSGAVIAVILIFLKIHKIFQNDNDMSWRWALWSRMLLDSPPYLGRLIHRGPFDTCSLSRALTAEQPRIARGHCSSGARDPDVSRKIRRKKLQNFNLQ